MNFWVFLTVGTVLGILLAAIGMLSGHRRKVKEMELAALKEQNSGQSDELNQKIDKLSKRVEVLEALVTDKGYELEQKISNLK